MIPGKRVIRTAIILAAASGLTACSVHIGKGKEDGNPGDSDAGGDEVQGEKKARTASGKGHPNSSASSAGGVMADPHGGPDRESYDPTPASRFLDPGDTPLSTFSIDVDTASYANVRRFLRQGRKPNRDAVRIEELINYFPYSYEPPTGDHPFAVHTEVADAPWKRAHRLVKVGIKGRELAEEERPRANLVFLLGRPNGAFVQRWRRQLLLYR